MSLLTNLKKNGYVIIKNAIKYPNKKLIKLKNNKSIHSKLLWDLRFETKKYFSKIWKTDNLVCSFDGYIFNTSNKLDWHVDQNMSHSKGLICVQGVLSLTQSNATQLLVKSHKYFNSFGKRLTSYNPNEWEFYTIPKNDNIWNLNLKIHTPILLPGDLLLFDSRLIHRVNYSKPRTAIYISMVPRSFVSKRIQKKRKIGFKKGYQTTHWCTRYIIVDKNTNPPKIYINELI